VTEYRRILLDGYPTQVVRRGDDLVAHDGRVVAIADAIHLAPAEPTKIIAVHLNFDSRTQEFMTKLPAAPTYFHKPITALNTHGGAVVRPAGCKWLNYEGEIVIVIGKTCRNIAPEDAAEYIAGYTVGNDYGLHDFRDTDAGSMLRVKGMDGFCPIGPGLVSGVDVRQSTLRSYKNGKMVQEGAVSEQIFDCGYLIADLARHITFLPGDILLTGTPANSRPLEAGDTIDIEVTGVGRLSNTVVETPAPRASEGFPPSPDSEGVRRVALGNEERLPDKFKTR
jgi:5-oxopent-3-ene-1,2,5-tricarboxylate decarboxylase/2-hydroxyhepta-2,4-diene-1,7-dioate isomerase